MNIKETGQPRFWMEIYTFQINMQAKYNFPKGSNINMYGSETLVSYLGNEVERTYLDHKNATINVLMN